MWKLHHYMTYHYTKCNIRPLTHIRTSCSGTKNHTAVRFSYSFAPVSKSSSEFNNKEIQHQFFFVGSTFKHEKQENNSSEDFVLPWCHHNWSLLILYFAFQYKVEPIVPISSLVRRSHPESKVVPIFLSGLRIWNQLTTPGQFLGIVHERGLRKVLHASVHYFTKSLLMAHWDSLVKLGKYRLFPL